MPNGELIARLPPQLTGTPLSASPYGPTTCTVYGPGYATQIIFDSRGLDVRSECQVWAANKPGVGWLWGYGPAAIPQATQLCALTDPGRRLTARVIEDNASLPVSAQERAQGLSDCEIFLASGWAKHSGES